MAMVEDITRAEKVTGRFVSRTIQLAYLLPGVLEGLVVMRGPPAISVTAVIEAIYLPWPTQMDRVFDDNRTQTSKKS